MEQVPHIAMYCQELPECLQDAVPLHLLPLVVKFLTDSNNQVSYCKPVLSFQACFMYICVSGAEDESGCTAGAAGAGTGGEAGC